MVMASIRGLLSGRAPEGPPPRCDGAELLVVGYTELHALSVASPRRLSAR